MTEPQEPKPRAHCPLCHYAIVSGGSVYTEGVFCADVAGCRRRALQRIAAIMQMSDKYIRSPAARLSFREHVAAWRVP